MDLVRATGSMGPTAAMTDPNLVITGEPAAEQADGHSLACSIAEHLDGKILGALRDGRPVQEDDESEDESPSR